MAPRRPRSCTTCRFRPRSPNWWKEPGSNKFAPLGNRSASDVRLGRQCADPDQSTRAARTTISAFPPTGRPGFFMRRKRRATKNASPGAEPGEAFKKKVFGVQNSSDRIYQLKSIRAPIDEMKPSPENREPFKLE